MSPRDWARSDRTPIFCYIADRYKGDALAVDGTEELTVAVTPEMMRALRASVGAGEYGSTSEAVRDALRLWKRKREEHIETLADIRARIRRSLDDPRPDLTLEEVDAELDEAFARAEQARLSGAA